MDGDKLLCVPYLVRSQDEGVSFSAAVRCIPDNGYFVVNNDRLVRLASGRLMFPASHHGESLSCLHPGEIFICYSDDDGVTWQRSATVVHSP